MRIKIQIPASTYCAWVGRDKQIPEAVRMASPVESVSFWLPEACIHMHTHLQTHTWTYSHIYTKERYLPLKLTAIKELGL